MRVSVAAFLSVLTMAGCGGETAPQGPPSVTTTSDIVALMNTPRLSSLSSAGKKITAEGQATSGKGDSLRTEWFMTVGAVEAAQQFGGSIIVRRIFDGTTSLQDDEELVGRLTDVGRFLSEEELNDHAVRHADAADVVVEEVNYVPFLGGTAEFVLRPTDESEFMNEFDERLSGFFRDFPTGPRPVLVTIVDSSGANRLIQGSVPLSDGGAQYARLEDGTKAQIAGGVSMGWAADDLMEVLGWGTPATVQEAPGS